MCLPKCSRSTIISMMNKKIIAKHVVTLNAADIKSRVVENFLDIINDFAVESIEDLDVQVTAFKECIRDIRDNNWQRLFSKGFTMLALDQETLKYVEDFFINKEKYGANDELELVIKNERGDTFIIEDRHIDF